MVKGEPIPQPRMRDLGRTGMKWNRNKAKIDEVK